MSDVLIDGAEMDVVKRYLEGMGIEFKKQSLEKEKEVRTILDGI